MRGRRGTATSSFGVSGRESHDASGFYGRFAPPATSSDDTVLPPEPVEEPFVCGDARSMSAVADGSVALVVTSPPYFAGKQYEEELAREGVPSSYLEYLEMLGAVLAECVRTLEPGGRIAVNVANLGRKPYRSLSADVIRILQDDLGLLLRGELIWQKADGASGSCAWGSYRSAATPVLRDVTERVIVASKGRFDRAWTVAQRAAAGLPHRSTLPTDDFLALTLDVWSLPPESARRVRHPAPFPVELPEQLIRLLTYEDDLVLDPFMGSGSAMVAAARLGRRYVGYDLDPGYVAIARERVAQAAPGGAVPVVPAGLRERTADEGRGAKDLAEEVLLASGFAVVRREAMVRGTGVVVSFEASDLEGRTWRFDVPGPFTSHRGGLLKTEAVWRALGRAVALRGDAPDVPVVLLATDLPPRLSRGDKGIRSAGPAVVFDVVDLLDDGGRVRLASYARGAERPAPGFWTEAELARRSVGPVGSVHAAPPG